MSLISNLFRRTPASADERRVVLGGAAGDAVRALAESSLAGTWARMSRAVDAVENAALVDAEEALAEAAVRHALSVSGALSARELRERTRAHRERVLAVGAPGPLLPRQLAPILSLVVEGMLRRAALEACGRDVELVPVGPRGRVALEWRAVEPWVALGLLEYDALNLAARWAEADPRLGAEMEAAHWWFDRWSAPGSHADFGQLRRMFVRTQEWALADRAAAALREPVLAHLLRDRAHERWPARQREVLERLPGSVVGVFTAREMDGAGAGLLVSAADGRELPFLHDPEVRIGAGELLVGRVIPFDGRWLGSYGMEAVRPEELSADRLLATFGELRAKLPDAAALEGALTRHLYGRTVPRAVPPAEDPDDALRRLHTLRDALADRVPAGAASSDVAAGDEALAEFRSGDPVLAAWVDALMDLARRRTLGRRLDARRRKSRANKGKLR